MSDDIGLGSKIQLFYSPGACSRVSMIALEEVGVEYVAHRVLLAAGEQKHPGFLSLSQKGKVPIMMVDGRVLTENVAILTYLGQRYPQAGLIPQDDPWETAVCISWLAWCASTLHPLMTRLRFPQRYCDFPEGEERVRELARNEMISQLAVAEAMLSKNTWLLGSTWSVADAYLVWIWARCPEVGVSSEAFPNLSTHEEQTMARPAVRRALVRESSPDS